MAETAVVETLVPRKPVVSEGDDAQSIPLTLVVSDRETVAELLQRSDGRERDEYALAALRIGVLSMKHARGQIDADAVRREGEKLLQDLKIGIGWLPQRNPQQLDQCTQGILRPDQWEVPRKGQAPH